MAERSLATVAKVPSGLLDRQLSRRLRRIEGQVRGIQGMIADSREPSDILQQLLAVQSATGAAIALVEREQLVQQVKASVQQALAACVGHCDLCDQLTAVTDALERLDASSIEQLDMKVTTNGRRPTPDDPRIRKRGGDAS